MEHTSYIYGNQKELLKLCLKCIKNHLKTYIITSSPEASKELSDSIWSADTFLPHALLGEKFAPLHYIAISEAGTILQNPEVIINYYQEFYPPNQISVTMKTTLKKLIAWGYEPKAATAVYSFESGAWQKK